MSGVSLSMSYSSPLFTVLIWCDRNLDKDLSSVVETVELVKNIATVKILLCAENETVIRSLDEKQIKKKYPDLRLINFQGVSFQKIVNSVIKEVGGEFLIILRSNYCLSKSSLDLIFDKIFNCDINILLGRLKAKENKLYGSFSPDINYHDPIDFIYNNLINQCDYGVIKIRFIMKVNMVLPDKINLDHIPYYYRIWREIEGEINYL